MFNWLCLVIYLGRKSISKYHEEISGYNISFKCFMYHPVTRSLKDTDHFKHKISKLKKVVDQSSLRFLRDERSISNLTQRFIFVQGIIKQNIKRFRVALLINHNYSNVNYTWGCSHLETGKLIIKYWSSKKQTGNCYRLFLFQGWRLVLHAL